MPASVYPTGVTRYDPDRTHDTYVLYSTTEPRTLLVDMNGNEVNEWPYGGFPPELVDPAVNDGRRGEVILQREPDIFANETLLRCDWDGEVVWEWGADAPDGAARQNHDLAPLPNGNLLVLSMTESPDSIPFPDQAIYEVTPAGEVVWEWYASEHLEDCGFTGEKQRQLLSEDGRPRSSIFVLNAMDPVGPNPRYEAGDDRFHPDNLVINSREGCFVAVVEKATGDVVWRLGPEFPAAYDHTARAFGADHGFPREVDSLSGNHDAHVIQEGRPGAGNLLVFDNQGAAGVPPHYLAMFPGSRVLEIDPGTKEIVWQYDASCSGEPYWRCYSSFISSARRLPNGNTLVCEGMNGRFLQVTPEGDVVWEFVNPHFGEWADHDTESGGSRSNWVYRAQPVPYDWVPAGTPRTERPVTPPEPAVFTIEPD